MAIGTAIASAQMSATGTFRTYAAHCVLTRPRMLSLHRVAAGVRAREFADVRFKSKADVRQPGVEPTSFSSQADITGVRGSTELFAISTSAFRILRKPEPHFVPSIGSRGGASHSELEHALKSARPMLTGMHPRHKWWKKLP